MLLIALPIMGGGMEAGAVPLSKNFDSSGVMTAEEAISVMNPAVAIGNAISIVLAGIIVKILTSKIFNGNGVFRIRLYSRRNMAQNTPLFHPDEINAVRSDLIKAWRCYYFNNRQFNTVAYWQHALKIFIFYIIYFRRRLH